MITNQITEEDKINLERKFKAFDDLLENRKEALGYIKIDPTLFAYFFFKDDFGKRFKALPWQDKFLNSKSKKRLLSCARQIGKSTTSGILALHTAYFNPGYTILVVSRTLPQAQEFVYRMKKFLYTSRFTIWDELQPKKKENKHEIILRSSQKGVDSRIIVVPATDAALGYTGHLVIGDEAARWEQGDYIFKEVLEPTTTFTDGGICLLSTPNGKNGFFWECFNMPDVWEIFHFDWTANPYLTKEMMEQKRKLHTSLSWAINYEAKFVVSQASYFNPNQIAKSVSEEAGKGSQGCRSLVISCDFGKIQDSCVIMIGNVENPKDKTSEQIVLVRDRIVKPLGTDYAQIVSELKELYKRLKPKKMILDATGVGEAPADMLIASGIPVEAFKFSIQSKADIMGNLKLLFEQGRIKIPKETELISQLESFEYEYTQNGNIKLHAPEGYHDDEVDSLALLSYGLTKNFFNYVSLIGDSDI
jgi:hypothetical protein